MSIRLDGCLSTQCQPRSYLYLLASFLLTILFSLWTFISAILAVASVLILISLEGKQKAKYYLFPVFAGLIAFRPMLVALRNGQIANLLLFLIVLAILFTSHNKRFFAGFLFVGLLYKHSLGIPIFGGIGLLLIFRKDWKSIAGMILGVIVWAGTAIGC